MTQNTDIPRRLSPWNPLDYLRLLWWVMVRPQDLVGYREVYGTEDEIRVREWLINTLAWLPLFLLTLALGLKTLPQERLEKPMLPSTYLWLSVGLALVWILTGWLAQKKNPLGTIVSLVMGFVSKLSIAGVIAFFVSLMLVLVIDTISSLLGVDSTIRGIVPGVVVFVTYLAALPLAEKHIVSSVKNSLKTGQSSWLLRGVVVTLVLAHSCLVWFSFLGGWRTFR